VAARKERDRRAALEALAGEALEDLGTEFNPFLEDGELRTPDDEAAGLALAATIAGASDDEIDAANPFALPGGLEDPSEDPAVNPFLEEAAVLAETGEEA
jgi:hypothetical protein